jgi:hypothetical protein
MAVTATKICDLTDKGTEKMALVDITDTSYATGGTAVAVTGFEKIKAVLGQFPGTTSNWDYTNQKLLSYWDKGTAASTALGEVAATSSLAKSKFVVIGN